MNFPSAEQLEHWGPVLLAAVSVWLNIIYTAIILRLTRGRKISELLAQQVSGKRDGQEGYRNQEDCAMRM